MSGDSLLPYHTARSSTWVDLFNTTTGKLQQQLHKDEYDNFKYAPIFESDFIHITKRGDAIDVHNWGGMVTMGITSTSPVLPLPDIMLLARWVNGCENHAEHSQVTKGKSHKAAKNLELTRILPLEFVRISTHNGVEKLATSLLRVKLATGRCSYLQLCPPLDAQEDLFADWEQLIYLLQPAVDSESNTYAVLPWDITCMPVFEEEDRRSPAVQDFQGKGDRDQVSVSSLHTCPEVAGATSAAFAVGEGIQLDSHKPDTMPEVATAKTKPTTVLNKASASRAMTEVERAGVAGGTAAGAVSMAVIESPAAEEQSTARAATASDGPGGSKTNTATGDTARTSLRSGKTALAGAANNSEYASSTSTSLSRGAGMTVVGAERTSKTVKARVDEEDEGTLISSLPQEGKVSEGDGSSQRVSQAHKGRRERREHCGEERAQRSSSLCSSVESHRKTAGSKTIPKAAGPSSGGRRATRDDEKDKGHGSPGGSEQGTAHKDISRAPITNESRTSHKSGRSLSPASSGPTTKRRSRISSFFRNMRARLTTKTVASSHNKHVSILVKPVEGTRMEAITETAESGQGLEITGVTSETMEPVTVEAHQ